MRPYSTAEDLEARIKLLEQALEHHREITHELKFHERWRDVHETYFTVSERLIHEEIQIIKFQLQLEDLLSGN